MDRLPGFSFSYRRPYRLSARICFILLAGALTMLFTACNNTVTTGRPTAKNTLAESTATARAALFSKPITYVALGASDAVGVGSSQPGAQGYVPLIAARLPQGSHMLNLGISGIRLHAALSEELPLALNTSPQLVTIWLVTNDFIGGVSYENYLGDLTTLLNQLRAKTRARIVMANLPDITLLPAFSRETSTQKTRLRQAVSRWDQGIDQVAARYGITLVDLLQRGSELTAHPEYISKDGFHPSPQGYVRLAELFWQAIQQG